MKGVTPIIATIILLLITIALASAAYTYMQGFFTQMTACTIDVVDSYPITTSGEPCAHIIIRNAGQSDINLCAGQNCDDQIDCGGITIVKTTGGRLTNAGFGVVTRLAPGGIATFIDEGCISGTCSYRFVCKAGAKAVTASVYCPSSNTPPNNIVRTT